MIAKLCNLLLLSMLMVACSNENRVIISGKVENAQKEIVYLEQILIDKTITIDSTTINRDGEFRFKTETQYPTFYNLRFQNGTILTVVGAPKEEIIITGKQPGLISNYWVDGSESSLWIKVLNFQIQNSNTMMDSLQRDFHRLPQNPSYDQQRQQISTQFDSIANKQINFSKTFILDHATSLAAYYALYQKFPDGSYILNPETNLHSYKVVASSLKAMYPDSPYTQAILNHLQDINKSIRNLRFQELIQSSDNQLPEIALPNVKGDTITLSSLRGKYILVDFTTLSGKASPEYIKEMKTIYNKFKNKGLEIYMVCLTDNVTDWKERVKAYGIDWIVVCESNVKNSRALLGWNIKTIPTNYIINKKYEIVGKDLAGRRLNERLTDIIK